MNANPSHQPTNHTQPKINYPVREVHDDTLENIADELTALARKKHPDGVLSDVLRGHEADIRQSAILLALTWYLKGGEPNDGKPPKPWIAARAIAGALNICKRDTKRKLLKEAENQRLTPPDTATTMHPSMFRAADWPADLKHELCAKAIRIALREGSISPCNAAVCEAVYLHGMRVIDLATQRGVKRSSIYQHLTKSRPYIREIIQSLEVPLDQIS